MLRDRGNIKWTAMMLPEHVAMLRKLKESQNYRTKPVIDEQQLEQFNYLIENSIKTKEPIKITYFKDESFKTIVATIRNMDTILKKIRVMNEVGEIVQICLENIIEIKIVD